MEFLNIIKHGTMTIRNVSNDYTKDKLEFVYSKEMVKEIEVNSSEKDFYMSVIVLENGDFEYQKTTFEEFNAKYSKLHQINHIINNTDNYYLEENIYCANVNGNAVGLFLLHFVIREEDAEDATERIIIRLKMYNDVLKVSSHKKDTPIQSIVVPYDTSKFYIMKVNGIDTAEFELTTTENFYIGLNEYFEEYEVKIDELTVEITEYDNSRIIDSIVSHEYNIKETLFYLEDDDLCSFSLIEISPK